MSAPGLGMARMGLGKTMIVLRRSGGWSSLLSRAAVVAALAAPAQGVALAADQAQDAINGCRAETAARLRVAERDVTVERDEQGPRRGHDRPLRWSTARGDEGTCSYQHGRVASWTADHKAPRLDDETACISAVARLVKKRAEDVDIVDVEKNTQTSSTVYWSTYQGETGTCTAAEGRIKRVDRD